MEPKISIIVPCYNQAQYLDECLESVLEQTFHDWECIIINDGSPDDTAEVSKKWIEKDLRFKYIYQVNAGLSATRNKGIENSIGEFILPLDADDKISKDYLAVCINEFLNDKDLNVVYGKAVKFGAINSVWILADYNFNNLLQSNMIFCSAMFKKTDWQKVNGYDQNMTFGYEDWEFWINILKDSGKVKRNLDCTFYYRIQNNNSMIDLLNKDADKKFMMQKYIFDKHKSLFTTQTDFDLFVENKLANKKLNSLHHYLSLSQLSLLIFKRFRYLVYLFLKSKA